MPVSSRAWTSYRESCGLSILSKVMTGWQRNCCVHLPCSKPLYLLWKSAFNLIKCVWVQGGIQYSHMLNVLTKHQWVGEELRKDMRVLMLTEWKLSVYLHICACVCMWSAHSLQTHLLKCMCVCICACMRDPIICRPLWMCLFVHTVCQFVCEHFAHAGTWVSVCVELQLSNTFKSLISPGKWQRSSHRQGMKTTFASDWSHPRH